MKSIKWISFCASNKILKTMLHFSPRAMSSTTQYPVTCKLGLFGEGQGASSILVDGVRINQPSGILLDSAFTELNGDYAGFIGICIEFNSRQQSVLFDEMSAKIELLSFSSSIIFHPTLIDESKSEAQFCKSFPVLRDTLTEPSLVIVNSTLSEFETSILNVENKPVVEKLQSMPLTVKEYSLDNIDELGTKNSTFNSCWTSGNLSLLRFSNGIPVGVGVYILCRDRATRRITSCFNL